MISYLSGTIISRGKGYVIIDIGRIGYKVFVNANLWVDLKVGQAAEFFIYEHQTDQGRSLFGVLNQEELDFFELLLSVSGVGPKTALTALGVAKIPELKSSIARGDYDLLNKVSGIGKKTAERIILELKSKVFSSDYADNTADRPGASDEIDALLALGYSSLQARQALNEVDMSITDSRERIKNALKRLSR